MRKGIWHNRCNWQKNNIINLNLEFMFKVKRIELKSNLSENALESSQMKQVLGGFASDDGATTGTATIKPTGTESPVSVSVSRPITPIPRK